jgi:hypothetical protein
MCKKLPSDAADFVMEAVPLLTNLLQYHDAKVVLLFYIKVAANSPPSTFFCIQCNLQCL